MRIKTLLIVLIFTSGLKLNSCSGGSQSSSPAMAIPAEMVLVKGGCYDMGDTFNDGDMINSAGQLVNYEKPVHKVCLEDFLIDKYEVRQSAYQAVMGSNPSWFAGCTTCPVEQVTWDEAHNYCAKVGKRLPTEAEWEYAAREGGKRVRYGTGKNEIGCDTANIVGALGLCAGGPVPVGSYPPNALGLYDMAGNVSEFVEDWYDLYDGHPHKVRGGAEKYARVIRGGSWQGEDGRASQRGGYNIYELNPQTNVKSLAPAYRNANYGFRCAK